MHKKTKVTTMASACRFGATSAAEQEERRLNLNAEKTLKANKFASKIFKEYLSEKGENADFETFSVSDLDNGLGRFYMDLRRVDGTSYKITSMEGIRHGINRYLKNPPFNKRHLINLNQQKICITDPSFSQLQCYMD